MIRETRWNYLESPFRINVVFIVKKRTMKKRVQLAKTEHGCCLLVYGTYLVGFCPLLSSRHINLLVNFPTVCCGVRSWNLPHSSLVARHYNYSPTESSFKSLLFYYSFYVTKMLSVVKRMRIALNAVVTKSRRIGSPSSKNTNKSRLNRQEVDDETRIFETYF